MIFDHLAPPQGPRGWGQKSAVTCLIHVSNSHTKFGWISSNGLGGDSMTDGRTDGWTDGGDCNIPIISNLKYNQKISIAYVYMCTILYY